MFRLRTTADIQLCHVSYYNQILQERRTYVISVQQCCRNGETCRTRTGCSYGWSSSCRLALVIRQCVQYGHLCASSVVNYGYCSLHPARGRPPGASGANDGSRPVRSPADQLLWSGAELRPRWSPTAVTASQHHDDVTTVAMSDLLIFHLLSALKSLQLAGLTD